MTTESTDEPVLYQFTFRAVARPDDAYYVTRWDRAKTYEVVAATRADGFEQLWALLGPAPTHRHWVAQCDGAKDIRLIQGEATR